MATLRVLRTKITPPRIPERTLIRPRVSQVLSEALGYRLTLLQASAGYGKSTALAALSNEGFPLIWYQVNKEDSDPLVFLQHLCHATLHHFPDMQGLPIQYLEDWDGAQGLLPSNEVLDQYINALSNGLSDPTFLILDDAHLVAETPEIAHLLDRLIALMPPDLHMLLAARPPLKLPNLYRWRARAEVLVLDQSLLAFTASEIAELFARIYKYELTQEEVESLHAATEGWTITLQLVWQSLRTSAAATVQEAIARQGTPLESLFDVLAREVLELQPADMQEFILLSATLRVMTPKALDHLRQTNDSTAMLAYLRRQELFVVDLGDGSLRYHPIFRRFLRQNTSPEQQQLWHIQAASYYRGVSDPDSVVYHLLQAHDFEQAASLLESYGSQLVADGRLDTLASYLDAIPPVTLQDHPSLIIYLGDLARLHSRFQEALGWYQQAENLWRERGNIGEVVRALRGQARVYLDTVNPSRAEELLQKALRLSDGTVDREARVRLYELLAENKLNAGKAEEAEGLRQQADELRRDGPSDSQLLYRVLLRTGRLQEARLQLERSAASERQSPVQTPRAHRETLFLLSLIYAFQGEAQSAYQAAIQGTRRGEEFASPFMTAVGYMRQGHALMLLSGSARYEQARQQFEKAVGLSRTLSVPRLRVEALWGLCRSYGYRGELAKAQQAALDGLEIAAQAGDDWVASITRLSLGAGFALAERYETALEWLNQAGRGFKECSDPFGSAAVRLWISLIWFRQGNLERLEPVLRKLLTTCRMLKYEFLFTRPTLLGVPDERRLVPMLILARKKGWEAAVADQLLREMGLQDAILHPGYQLRVQTLGAFQVWLGDQPIPTSGWRREKTRQLFQLLLTYRHAPLDREQIFEYLWPGLDPAAAGRNFKVTLNTLYTVLEPQRAAGQDSAFVLRQGTIYGLRPNADLWLDCEIFESLLGAAEQADYEMTSELCNHYENTLSLYQGEYLPEARYETWSAAEREHLAVRYLQAADRLCELYLQSEKVTQTIELCQRILSIDNCWERAYRHLMEAYHRLGDRGQVARTYQRCQQTLQSELEVMPSQETQVLFHRLTQDH